LLKAWDDRIRRFNRSEISDQNDGKKQRFWLKPDLPDNNDYLYAASLAKPRVLPTKVDLRRRWPKVYDQGQIGSSTANAIAVAIEFDSKKQKLSDFIPSRLFIYYNARGMQHSVPLDNGAQIRDGINASPDRAPAPKAIEIRKEKL